MALRNDFQFLSKSCWPVLPLRTASLPMKSIRIFRDKPFSRRGLTCPIPSSVPPLVSEPPPDQATITLSQIPLDVETAHIFNPEVSPVEIDENGSGAQTYSADADALVDSSLSDPEGDKLSDSSSEYSFATVSGRCSPLADLDYDDDELPLPPSLLFHVDQPPLAKSGVLDEQAPQSFKASFLPHVLEELHDMLNDVCVKHDPFTSSLNIFIGQMPEGQERGESSPGNWSQNCVSSLSIIISELAGVGGMMERQCQLLLCILRWAQINFDNFIEEVNVFIPALFSLGDASYTLEDIQAFTNMHTLRWSGDARVLHGLLPWLICPELRILKIRGDLSIDDALLITHLLDGVQLFALELGCITGAPSHISPSAPILSAPVALPCLDSIKLTTSIPVERLCSALARPTLCKCEFDFSTARASGEAAIRSVLASPLLGEHILFIDIILEGAFEGMEHVMGLIKQKAPFSHASFRREVSRVGES